MKTRFVVGIGALALFAGAAVAGDITTVNGVNVQNRVWNDFPTSNLTPNMAFPANVGWDEQFPAGTVGNFANKHLAYLSNDGGASAYQHWVGQGFTMSFTARIAEPTGAGVPRKEGMLQIENPRPALGFTDEGHVLLGSEGEVAIFGGVMPFFSCRVPGSAGVGAVGVTGADWYTPGTVATVSFTYYAPGEVDAVLGGYRLDFTDAVTGFHSSGVKLWGNAEPDGTVGFNTGTKFAFQAQNQRNPLINDVADTDYGNISIVPAPGVLAALGLAGLAAGRRRR
jgi:hypothetical protein